MSCLFFLTPCLSMSDWECSLSAHTPNSASAHITPSLTFLEGLCVPNSLWLMIQTYHSFTWIQGIAFKYCVNLTREDYYPIKGCWLWCGMPVVSPVRHIAIMFEGSLSYSETLSWNRSRGSQEVVQELNSGVNICHSSKGFKFGSQMYQKTWHPFLASEDTHMQVHRDTHTLI